MKALIALFLLLLAFWLGKHLYLSYQAIDKRQPNSEQNTAAQPPPSASSSLPGLPPSLETSLSIAEKNGAAGLGAWLKQNRIYVQDPRLAAIELDYVLLISHQDPAEARRIFKQVQDRTPTFSPVYERVKRLEKTFQ
jgi:hypothetical protein